MLVGAVRSFIDDEAGATAIEYGLLGMLVAIAIIGSFTLVGNGLQGLFNNGTADLLANKTATIR